MKSSLGCKKFRYDEKQEFLIINKSAKRKSLVVKDNLNS